jgi:hypothetical protein
LHHETRIGRWGANTRHCKHIDDPSPHP